jgi:glycosyltransferase involved in cell wall biosynthesis
MFLFNRKRQCGSGVAGVISKERHRNTSTIPKVSVVMPAYNAAAYLDESIGSILTQTFRDFGFIIIDKGSSDVTGSILEKYQELDGRVRVHHQKNQGMIIALNRGCRLARGQYIARMDADDVRLPHRFERQLEYIGDIRNWNFGHLDV